MLAYSSFLPFLSTLLLHSEHFLHPLNIPSQHTVSQHPPLSSLSLVLLNEGHALANISFQWMCLHTVQRRFRWYGNDDMNMHPLLKLSHHTNPHYTPPSHHTLTHTNPLLSFLVSSFSFFSPSFITRWRDEHAFTTNRRSQSRGRRAHVHHTQPRYVGGWFVGQW